MAREWPDWSGQTVACIGTGPSLRPDHIEAVRVSGVRTIGLCDIGLSEKWIDIWYAADARFWQHYRPRSAAIRVCAQPAAMAEGLADLYLDLKDREKIEARTPGYAQNGRHSGFQAMDCAVTLGAKRVVLVGYDCKPRGQMSNFFGRKCAKLDAKSNYAAWAQAYERWRAPQGVEVLNATPGSAITRFPFVDLGDALRL